MLQTVKDACKFDPKAIDYALSDQIENLDGLIGHDPKAVTKRRRDRVSDAGFRTPPPEDSFAYLGRR
jgi:hypothetical protein